MCLLCAKSGRSHDFLETSLWEVMKNMRWQEIDLT